MTSFAAGSLKRLLRLLHPAHPGTGLHPGEPAVLDGLTAVAFTEASLSDTAGLGATFPAAAAARAWSRQRQSNPVNRFGEVLSGARAAGPRGALAAALGASLAGQRATAFVSGPDLLASADLVAGAAGSHVPLVIHMAARAVAGHAQALGTGHEAYHAVSDLGCFQLFAVNVQEAVDLALIARRVAERALVPAIVAMDGEATALAVQDVHLPDETLLRNYLGEAFGPIEVPTEGQRFMFGLTRRRVPRRYDLDRPMMLAPLVGPESWALGAAGRRPYFDEHVPAILDEAFEAFAAATGRRYDTIVTHRLDGAKIVLVAQGAAVETACAVADAARRELHASVGVLGVRCLRPLDTSKIAGALTDARVVAVLERTDAPLAGDGPLARELRGPLGRTRLVGVPCGLGGLPLRAADLMALVKRLMAPAQPGHELVYLGVDFTRAASSLPKHQALLDALRRSHPGLETLGLKSADPPPETRPDGSTTIALDRLAGTEHEALAPLAAALLHETLGGHVRSRPGLSWQRYDEPCADILTWAPEPLREPGDDVPIDIRVTARDTLEANEALLGGLVAMVARRSGRPGPSAAKLRTAREAALGDCTEQQRQQRLDALIAGFEAGQPDELSTPPAPQPAPAEIQAPAVASLPRFWDHTGVFYREGRTAELAAEPGLAAGAIPPLSSTLRDVGGPRRVLPVFDPATCDGSRDLWTSCPDGAVAPLVISARALLNAGLDLVTESGGTADVLRSIAGKLAKAAARLVGSPDGPPGTAGELFQAAARVVLEKMDADRQAPLREALAAVIEQVGALPIARWRRTPDLFTLVVNPDACKSPETILAVCEGRGIKAVQNTPENIAAARGLWRLWKRLPDTPGETIEQARNDPEIGPLAAILLSRHCLHAMAGGDGAEAGSGARLALSRVLAVAEFHYQPRVQKQLQEIDELRRRLAGQIRQTLADAIPATDLEALADGLEALGRGDVDLAALSSKIDTAVGGGHLDGARLARLVEAARGLADLQWRLEQGHEGLGRARVGLVIAPGAVAGWAGAFPYNAFQCPVLIDFAGDTADLARGLIEGQLRQAIAGFRLLRWARAELDTPDAAPRLAETLAGLRFEDLTDEQRALCPPILVVGDEQALAAHGQLTRLLDSGLPLKVVVLGGNGGAADDGLSVDALGSYPAGGRIDVALLALLTRRAYVAQTSFACPDHFASSVLAALAFDGPGLIHVHAPSPQRHGFAVARLHEQARLAVQSRAFALLTFDPAAEGVFGSRLDLSGNPDASSTWVTGTDGQPITPVSWAATEQRFAEHLQPLAGDDPQPTPIAEYLRLEPKQRQGRTPFVVVTGGDGEGKLRVDPMLAADAEQRLHLWRTLQELAGVVTPFTRTVREQARRDLAAEHDAEIAKVRQEYEARIAGLWAEYQVQATQRVTERLMTLAGHDAPDNGEGES